MVKKTIYFGLLLLLITNVSLAQFWRKFDNGYFRKSGMAFKNQEILCNKKIKFNGIYKFSAGSTGYLYLIFYPNGLMCKSSNYRKSAKLASPNCLFKNWNDTILCFSRDYNSTMSGKAFHISLFKIIDEYRIQEITFSIIVDESKSLDENIKELCQPHNSVSANSLIYTFEELTSTPSLTNCIWLKKKYFWASDTLYNNFFNYK